MTEEVQGVEVEELEAGSWDEVQGGWRTARRKGDACSSATQSTNIRGGGE